MRILYICVTFLIGVSVTEGGIRCWNCLNARSNRDCQRTGRLEQCLINQFFCQNEIRAIAGGKYFEITKRCKQDIACPNNQMQNYTGSYPFQCQTDEPHSVCRCCCGFDNCNGPDVKCIEKKPPCPEPPQPEGGYTVCETGPLFVGDTCYYRCRNGFKLVGNTSTTCELTNENVTRWNNPPPTCEEPECDPPQTDPEHGSVVCTDGVRVGSECTFQCFEPWYRVGPELVVCNDYGLWTDDPPVCQEAKCKEPKPDDPNRLPAVCTDRFNYDSDCSYKCKKGYDLTGAETITCGPPVANGIASWSDPAPRCQKGKCEIQQTNATVVCTDGVMLGSVCTITCDEDHYLKGGDGKPIPGGVQRVNCTDELEWSQEAGTCHPKECDPDAVIPGNGTVSCTKGSYIGSVCRYKCKQGWELTTTNANRKCVNDPTSDSKGKWTPKEEPKCEKGKCKIDETNATVVCTDGVMVGSVCTITCDEKHYLKGGDGQPIPGGVQRVNCTDVKEWSQKAGTCHRKKCTPNPSIPGEGSVECTDGSYIDSVCRYKCKQGYELTTTNANRRCVDDPTSETNGKWTPEEEPKCKKSECDDIPVLPGLTPTCTNGKLVGSVCTYECDDPSQTMNGIHETECKVTVEGQDPVWDPTVTATCEAKTCVAYPGQRPAPRVGSLTCDNPGNSPPAGTICTLECNYPNYGVKQKSDQSRCVIDEEEGVFTAVWTDTQICCVECTENQDLDVVFLLDNAETIPEGGTLAEGEAFWKIKTDFALDFTNFLVTEQGFNLNVSYIAFGEELAADEQPEQRNVVDFRTVDGSNPVNAALRRAVNNLPFEQNDDTSVGDTMRYVKRAIFNRKRGSGNRVPVVILVTTRVPSFPIDSALTAEQAEAFKEESIHLRIVPLAGEDVADPGDELAKNIFRSYVTKDQFVVDTADQPDDRTFLDYAANDLIQETRAYCNARQQDNLPCVY